MRILQHSTISSLHCGDKDARQILSLLPISSSLQFVNLLTPCSVSGYDPIGGQPITKCISVHTLVCKFKCI